MLGAHVHAVDVVQGPVPGLPHHRQAPCGSAAGPRASRAAIRASRTTLTLVLVIATGGEQARLADPPSRSAPCCCWSRWQPANAGSVSGSSAEGNSTVTPVRTVSPPNGGVAWPTRTPATSVIALSDLGRRVPMAMPRSCARMGRVSQGAGSARNLAGYRLDGHHRAKGADMDVQELAAQARDALTVKRVFGDPYEKDGLTIILAARVQGAVGGGSGEDPQGQGKGSGGGYGVTACPVGAFIVRDGELTWQPAMDVTRIVLGGQLVAIVALLTLGPSSRPGPRPGAGPAGRAARSASSGPVDDRLARWIPSDPMPT